MEPDRKTLKLAKLNPLWRHFHRAKDAFACSKLETSESGTTICSVRTLPRKMFECSVPLGFTTTLRGPASSSTGPTRSSSQPERTSVTVLSA